MADENNTEVKVLLGFILMLAVIGGLSFAAMTHRVIIECRTPTQSSDGDAG